LYVDDAILALPSKRAIESVIASLSKIFELKVGEATMFVGIEINRDKGTDAIRLLQTGYVRKLLETFDMSNAKPVSTPMAIGVPKLDVQLEVKFPYREAVGSLLYAAMIMRPDIVNAVSAEPTPVRVRRRVHRESCATCAISHLTMDVALKYGTNGKMDIIGWTWTLITPEIMRRDVQ